MGHRTDWLALAGTSRVKSYFRKSSSGKTVQVDAYTRSVDKMSFQELQDEFKRLQGSTKPADVNRRAAVVGRLRKSHNHEPGESFDADKSTAAGVAERKRISAENNARIERERIAAGKPSQAENLERIKKSAAENRARIDREREAAKSKVESLAEKTANRQALREAAKPAAEALKKRVKTLDGLEGLAPIDLQKIVDATVWNEPGDEWGERAMEIIQKRRAEFEAERKKRKSRGLTMSDIDPDGTGWSASDKS